MKTPAANDPSLRLVDANASAGRGKSLQAGALVSVAVRERLGPGLYRVAVGPRLLTASSAAALEPGTVLKARVERSGGALLLRLEDERLRDPRGGLTAALTAASLPDDAASRLAATALLREGLALEPRALARVRRAALREAAEGGELSELAAELESKGLPAEGEILEDVLSAYAGSSGERRGPGGSGSGGLPGGGEESREGERSAAIPESDLPRVLGAFLRELAMRADPGAEGSALALFNHLRGPEGGCVIVPFRFALDAVDFTGSFRIQLPYVRGGQGLLEARFAASSGGASKDWSFSLAFGGGRSSALGLRMPEGGAGRVEIGELAAELAPLSCSVRASTGRDETGPRAEGFDGDA